MQFWPRIRAKKGLPRVNWKNLYDKKEGVGLLGFIGYKAGMKSAFVKDLTNDSMTKNKKIAVPVTIIECPSMKILAVRFYNNTKVVLDILNENLDKELKSKVKLPKQDTKRTSIDSIKPEDYDDIKIIAYSQVKKTGIKKSPDIAEIGLTGSNEEKLAYIKDKLNKEILVSEVFKDGVVDARGVTIGRGTQGPVKRFGIKLRFHKTEKGQRKVGSIGPWHPARVSYRVPMAGQLGFFNRIVYNCKIVFNGKIAENDINEEKGIHKYGKVKNDYLLLAGSIQGPKKRQLLITQALRPTKKQTKRNYEFLELR